MSAFVVAATDQVFLPERAVSTLRDDRFLRNSVRRGLLLPTNGLANSPTRKVATFDSVVDWLGRSGIVGGRTIEAGNWNIIDPQIDAQMRAMVDRMIEDPGSQDSQAG